jgi:hypothetical protein
MVEPAAVHVRHRRGDLAEVRDELAQFGRLDLVEGLAVDLFPHQLDAGGDRGGLVQTRVTLWRRLALGCLAGRSSAEKTCGQDSTAMPRGKCYPGSGRHEPGHRG